jgi:hypothetical protein
MSRIGIAGFGALVMIVGSACAIMSTGSTPEAGVGAGGPTDAPGEQGTVDTGMLPVSINQGLASLDSYQMTFTTDTLDSVAQERTVTTFVVAHDRDADASYNRTETQVTTGDGEVLSEEARSSTLSAINRAPSRKERRNSPP